MTWRPVYEPPKKGKGSRLSPLMERFVEEYMVDFVAHEAVLRAGYKVKNAYHQAAFLMNHPLVMAEIERRKEIRLEKNELTAQYVLMKLQKIVEATEEESPQAALRGLELIGKHLGMYRDRQEISGPDGEAIQMEQKTKQNAADFASKLSSLIKSAGTGNVVEFPDGRREGRA